MPHLKGQLQRTRGEYSIPINQFRPMESGKKAKGQPDIKSPSMDSFAQSQAKPMTKLRGQVK